MFVVGVAFVIFRFDVSFEIYSLVSFAWNLLFGLVRDVSWKFPLRICRVGSLFGILVFGIFAGDRWLGSSFRDLRLGDLGEPG